MKIFQVLLLTSRLTVEDVTIELVVAHHNLWVEHSRRCQHEQGASCLLRAANVARQKLGSEHPLTTYPESRMQTGFHKNKQTISANSHRNPSGRAEGTRAYYGALSGREELYGPFSFVQFPSLGLKNRVSKRGLILKYN